MSTGNNNFGVSKFRNLSTKFQLNKNFVYRTWLLRQRRGEGGGFPRINQMFTITILKNFLQVYFLRASTKTRITSHDDIGRAYA